MKNFKSSVVQIICLCLFFFANGASASPWKFKRDIIIQNGPEQIKNVVVEILLEKNNFDYASVSPDGSDLRFFADKNLKGNGLNYWIEQWNEDGQTRIWLKIPMLKANEKLKVAMFYGDSSVKAFSNGDNTFLFFDDFDKNDFSKKWKNTSIGEIAEKDGILKLKENDGEDGVVTANFVTQGKMIIRTSYQRENADEHWTRAGIGGWDYFFCFGDHTEFAGTGTNWLMFYNSASLSSLTALPLIKVANGKINNKFRRVSFTFDGTNLIGQQDETIVKWPIATSTSKLSLRVLDNDAWDNFNYVSVSPFSKIKPIVNIGKQEAN